MVVKSDQLKVARARSSFMRGLVEEHLDEMSWLYDQQLYLLEDSYRSWLDVKDNEQRFFSHLYSLELLGSADLRHSLESFEDPGGLHAAVCLLCIQGDFQALSKFLKSIDWTDEEMVCAIFRAFIRYTPDSFRDPMQDWIVPRYKKLADEVAVIFGYRRWPLDTFLRLKPRPITPGIAWAIGRSGSSGYYDALRMALDDHNPAVKTEAAIALLRRGQQDQVPKLIESAKTENWPMLALSLSCDLETQQELVRTVSSNPSTEGLQALGLLGERLAVDLLISQLNQPELAKTASFALHLITGANLREEVFVPEEEDEDLLDEEDLEKQGRGESLHPPGEQPGENIERISEDPKQWNDWWVSSQKNYRQGVRYRLGKPCSPIELIETIRHPQSPAWARRFSYEELVIRYRVDLAFETEYLVSEQMEAISKYDKWIRSNQKTHTAGKWYLAGRMI